MKSLRRYYIMVTAGLGLFGAAGCSSPSRLSDTTGERADYARLQDIARDYQTPNGKLDPAILLDPDLYGGAQRRTAPVFDLPAANPPGKK